ncbi:MAG: outer membrane protein assembly factor BamA [Candidatus Methylacidiphilales bacterium]
MNPSTTFLLKRCLALYVITVLLLVSTSPVNSQETTDAQNKTVIQPPSSALEDPSARGPVVKEIEIEFVGAKTVDRSLIISNMRTTVGQPYSLSAVQEDVRNLYATGLFVNLRIYDEPLADGVKVVVIVQPKPVVKQIVVNGANKIKERVILKKIKSKAGDPLSEQQVADDAREVKDYLQNKGFFESQVEYKIDVNEQVGRAVVTFTVREGSRSFIRHVTFKGNDTFEEKELRKGFTTRKKNLFSFLNKSGVFKQEELDADLKKLRDFYHSNGYIDFAVKDIVYTYPEEDTIDIEIQVFEGIPYSIGEVSVKGNTLYTREQVMDRLTMIETGVFSPQGLEKDVESIKDLYGENGYIEADVRPIRQPNIESGRMDILYEIVENSQSYVDKIIIQGNNRTKDKVLRRELAVAPGEVYDSVRVDASKTRLENLGYFSKVDTSPRDTSVPNRKDLVVTVEEQRTGSVTFGAGFSTVDSILGFAEVTQGNFDWANWPSFTGAGQKFRARIQYGLRRRDALLSWTEPWFLDRQVSFGFDLFYNEASFLSDEYDQRRYGAAIRVGKALNQFWRVGLRYQIEEISIFDVKNDAPFPIREEEGTRSKSSVRGTLTYDSRDNLFLTRSGEKVEFAAEGAGGPLGFETDIWKLEFEAQKWWELPWDLIFSLRGVTGVADSFGDSDRVPLFDRFFIGGSRSVRGFGFRDVGPRIEGEPIGGRTMGYGNAEITFPIMDRVRGAVFMDAGFNNTGVFDYSMDNINVGTGIGLRMNLPIGPLRFDLGFPVVVDENNEIGDMEFHFDVGYQF